MSLKHHAYEVTSADGIRGLMIDVPDATSLHYEIFFHGGYHAFDQPKKRQIAHVLEHIAADGASTEYGSKAAYLHDFYKNGAYTNAMTYYAGIWYVGNNVTDEWQRILRLRRLSIEHPMLDEDTFESELKNATAEIKRNVNSYARVSYTLAVRALGVPSTTDEDDRTAMQHLTLQDVSDFYHTNHVMANMRFSISGNIAKSSDAMTHSFDSWNLAKGEESSQAPVTMKRGGALAYKKVESTPSVYMTLTFGVERRLSQDERAAFQVLNAYLVNLRSSKILGEARRRGIAYELHGYIDTDAENITMWHMWSPIGSENIRLITSLIVGELRKVIDTTIPIADFAYAVSYCLGRARQQGQTPESLSDLYTTAYFLDNTVYDFRDVNAVYGNVTPELIQRLVREFVGSQRWALAGVGETSEDDFKKIFDTYQEFVTEVQ